MTSNEARRRRMHEGLKAGLDEDTADAVMESLPPYDWHEIATKDDLELLRREIQADIRTSQAELETRITREMTSNLRVMILTTVTAVVTSVGTTAALVA